MNRLETGVSSFQRCTSKYFRLRCAVPWPSAYLALAFAQAGMRCSACDVLSDLDQTMFPLLDCRSSHVQSIKMATLTLAHVWPVSSLLPTFQESRVCSVHVGMHGDELVVHMYIQVGAHHCAGGKVGVFDLRRNKPLVVKDHMYDAPIKAIKFHFLAGSHVDKEHAVSVDSHVVKVRAGSITFSCASYCLACFPCLSHLLKPSHGDVPHTWLKRQR
jgi:hypothetical protein